MKKIGRGLAIVIGLVLLVFAVTQLGALSEGGGTVVHEIAAVCWAILGVQVLALGK